MPARKYISFINAFPLNTASRVSPFRPAINHVKTTLHIKAKSLCTACVVKTGNETSAKLVTADWLHTHLDTKGGDEITILDARGRVAKPEGRVTSGFQHVEYHSDENAYYGAHIPHARFVDWQRVNLKTHTAFCEDMAQAGLQPEQTVVVYDWGDMLFATRVWFALVALGCSDVRVLDGGWAEWDSANWPVSIDTACPLTSYSEFESPLAETEVPYASVSLQEMRRLVDGTLDTNNGTGTETDTEGTLILDARSNRQFTGQERRAARAGHISGAVNVPFRCCLNDNASATGIRSVEDLQTVFKRHDDVLGRLLRRGVSGVTYCNGGVASSLVLFCLVRCGVRWEDVRNYCGSFNEWGNLNDTAIQCLAY